jgi:hypothetical protein
MFYVTQMQITGYRLQVESNSKKTGTQLELHASFKGTASFIPIRQLCTRLSKQTKRIHYNFSLVNLPSCPEKCYSYKMKEERL